MRDEPFVAVTVSPEFGAGHEEAAPPDPPFFGVGFPVGFGDERFEFIARGVHAGEPGFGGFLIVAAADLPVLVDFKVILKVEEKVVGGHLAAGEKVAGHPVALVFRLVMIGVFAVGEDVDEEFTVGFEPFRDS